MCEKEDKTQKHIIECPVINKERDEYERPILNINKKHKKCTKSSKINRAFFGEYEDKEKI